MMKINYPIDIFLCGDEQERAQFYRYISGSSFSGLVLIERMLENGDIILQSDKIDLKLESKHHLSYLAVKNTYKFCLQDFESKNTKTLHLKDGIAITENGDTFDYQSSDGIRKVLAFYDHIFPLNVLILAGGESQRMGENKSLISYHSTPQYQHLIEIAENLNLPYYISMRKGQEDLYEVDVNNIVYDRYENYHSPLNGILSAMEQLGTAILVLATDLPYIEQEDVVELIKKRDPIYYATAHHNEATGFPDPLFTILEPITHNIYTQYKAGGYQCPRKLLINAPISVIQPRSQDVLINANRQEDKLMAMSKLKK